MMLRVLSNSVPAIPPVPARRTPPGLAAQTFLRSMADAYAKIDPGLAAHASELAAGGIDRRTP